MAPNHGRDRSLRIFLLLAGWLARAGLALYASPAETGEANSRLLRSPDLNSGLDDAVDSNDLVHIQLDSRGAGRQDAPAALAAMSNGTIWASPILLNGDFEVGSETDEFQLASATTGGQVQEWSRLGSSSGTPSEFFIKSGNPTFRVAASHGDYLLGLVGEGSGIWQSVPGHVVGQWYRLKFHAGYCSTGGKHCSAGQAKIKVLVDAKEKFNEAVASGTDEEGRSTLGWYEVTYKAPYENVVITFEHAGPSGDRTAFLDGIDIKPVELWDIRQNGRPVLLQKVICNGYPSEDTCTRGRFLTVGGYNSDGSAAIMESSAASLSAVWTAIHNSDTKRWTFQSQNMPQPTTGGHSAVAPTEQVWYLHSDYNSCEARNFMQRATAQFDVRMTEMNLHQVSSIGTECGSLFAIQKYYNF